LQNTQLLVHVKKSGQIEPAMKQIIFILVLFFTILSACSDPEPPEERLSLHQRIQQSDSLAAAALLDSIRAKRERKLETGIPF
jgi:hypothetical protein